MLFRISHNCDCDCATTQFTPRGIQCFQLLFNFIFFCLTFLSYNFHSAHTSFIKNCSYVERLGFYNKQPDFTSSISKATFSVSVFGCMWITWFFLLLKRLSFHVLSEKHNLCNLSRTNETSLLKACRCATLFSSLLKVQTSVSDHTVVGHVRVAWSQCIRTWGKNILDDSELVAPGSQRAG